MFNDTVNIVEYEEGYDGETYVLPHLTLMMLSFFSLSLYRFFMYVFMVSGISLLMFIVHYVYTTVRRVSQL